jgi:hypothetical protein
MKLKSFGCSFIFGSDLKDDVSSQMLDWSNNGIYIKPSCLTWPALLANHYNYDYISYALPGIGNLQILESVLNEINVSSAQDLFVIQWTWIDRFDYENRNRTERENFWTTILPNDKDKISETYLKYIHSQYRDKLSTLILIKTAIDLLEQKNIPYIMTNIDDLVFEDTWHSSLATQLLQKDIKSRIVSFDGFNFLEWSKKCHYKVSESMHPLEDAHRHAADLIISYNLLTLEQ